MFDLWSRFLPQISPLNPNEPTPSLINRERLSRNATRMKKQHVLANCLFVLVAAMMLASAKNLIAAEDQSAAKPNIVLFLVDDMGWMDSTPYGSKYYETPNMKRLEGQSMRFTDAYAVPLCSPTRASILSGQYSARHGVTPASGHRPAAPANASSYRAKASPNQKLIYANSKNHLDLDLVTLAEVLHDAAFREMAPWIEPGALAREARI